MPRKKKADWDDHISNDICDVCGDKIEEDRRKGYIYVQWLCVKDRKTNATFYRLNKRTHPQCAEKAELIERIDEDDGPFGYAPVRPIELDYAWAVKRAEQKVEEYSGLREIEKDIAVSVQINRAISNIDCCTACGKALDLGDWFITTSIEQPPFPPYDKYDWTIYAEWDNAGIKCGCAEKLELVDEDFVVPEYNWRR